MNSVQNRTNPTNPVPYMIERKNCRTETPIVRIEERRPSHPPLFKVNIAMPCKIENRHMAQTNQSSEEKTSEQTSIDRSRLLFTRATVPPIPRQNVISIHQLLPHIKPKTRAGNKTYGIYFTPESSKLEIISSGSCSPPLLAQYPLPPPPPQPE